MKRLLADITWFVLAVAAAVVLGVLASKLCAHPLQKPGSSLVELSHPVLIPTAPSSATAPNPLGTGVGLDARSVLVLKVMSAPTGGSGQTLDVYFQSSSDDRQSWNDFAEVHATATGTYYIPVSAIAVGSTSVAAVSDGSLSTNTAIQGPIGNMLRTKFSCNLGTGTTGMWAYQAYVLPD
jgi:hypothetical protein